MVHAFILIMLLSLMVSVVGAQSNRRDGPLGDGSLRMMSFNIRCSTALGDGENHWSKRREIFLQAVERFDPDLLGLQEVVADQADELRERFKRTHTFVGVGRDDGKRAGEFAAIMFRTDRFDLLDHGHIWLSEAPEKPGSVSWDSALTRMASWVKLRNKRNPTRGDLIFLNTHFDHIGKAARLESAKLLRRRLGDLSDNGKLAVLFSGDLNCFEDDAPVAALLRGDERLPALIDVYRAVHPARAENEASFHGYKGDAKGSRIDFIFHSAQLVVREATIRRSAHNGRYPSDHFAVTATLQWAEK